MSLVAQISDKLEILLNGSRESQVIHPEAGICAKLHPLVVKYFTQNQKCQPQGCFFTERKSQVITKVTKFHPLKVKNFMAILPVVIEIFQSAIIWLVLYISAAVRHSKNTRMINLNQTLRYTKTTLPKSKNVATDCCKGKETWKKRRRRR